MATLSPPTSPQPHHDGNRRPSHFRQVSSMSHASTGSHHSKGSGSHKLDLTESAKDKKRLNTKADPSRAMQEAQPSEIALEDANLEDIRLLQHKDAEGNLIVDPDRSNPTRPRMERPLDTIRSFNAAAEGTSRSRASSYHGRPQSTYGSTLGSDVGGGNRRSSYYGGSTFSPSPQRPRHGNGYGSGYYRNSAYGFPQYNLDEMPDEGSYQPPPRQMRHPMGPMYNQQTGYPQPPYGRPHDSPTGQHSYETMTSGSDENGKSTNPSSLNSSYDHLHQMQMRKQENLTHTHDQYNNDTSFAPVSPQQMNNYSNFNGNAHQQNGNTHVRDYDPYSGPSGSGSNGNYGVPRPPPKEYVAPPVNNPQQMIKFSGSSGPGSPPTEPKRKSWLKRTFSRKNRSDE